MLMAWFWGEEGRDGVAIVVSRLDLGVSCWSDLQVVSVQVMETADSSAHAAMAIDSTENLHSAARASTRSLLVHGITDTIVSYCLGKMQVPHLNAYARMPADMAKKHS